MLLSLATLAVLGPMSVDSLKRPAARPVVSAERIKEPVKIDGVLDEPVWQRARPVSGFVQSEPHEGEAATEATEVRVAYDDHTLYIGAKLSDRDPGRLIVNDIKKDFTESEQDDFEVLLDTFADRRNGYVFITNPGGAKSDRQIANEGREINTSWDAVWSVATKVGPDGWVVEMAIPFKSLRFSPTRGSWGVNFSRRIRRNNEVTFWAPVPRSYNLARVSLAGELAGLNLSSSGRNLRVKPYVAGRTVRETGGLSFDQQADVGLDLKAGIGGGLTLDATVNPDFAQVEADEQQVNLTQFSKFFPEKREFFLENSGTFYVGDAARNNRISLVPAPDEDLLLFFSRRVGLDSIGRTIRIPAGVRLTGSAAGFSVGAFSMQTEASRGNRATNYSVLRLRRNLRTGTDIGVIVMNRQATDTSNDYNRVAGIDANIRFFGRLDWNSYLIGSRAPGVPSGQYAWRSTLNYEGNFVHVKGGVLELGDGFRDDLGFFRRTGVRKYLIDTGIRPRLQSLQQIGIREMHPHIVWDFYEGLDEHHLIAKRLHTGYTFFLNNGGFAEISFNPNMQEISKPFQISTQIDSIPVGRYQWNEYQLFLGSDPSRAASISGRVVVGGLWSGRQKTVNATVTYKPSYRFRVSGGIQRTAADLDQPANSHFTETLWTFRANYSFSTTMFLDALTQYDPAAHELNANVRFNLIHHPLSDVYLVFNEQRISDPLEPHTNPGRSVILKVTQMLSF